MDRADIPLPGPYVESYYRLRRAELKEAIDFAGRTPIATLGKTRYMHNDKSGTTHSSKQPAQ